MENASKALIMAAGVLIGLMVLGLFVYLFTSFGASTAQMGKQITQDQLNQFNSQFTSYEGKEGLTIYDVITVANLATENNKYYNYTLADASNAENNSYVKILLNGIQIENQTNYYYNGRIKNEGLNENLELPTYNCTTTISSVTGRVYLVSFTLKNK